MNRFIYRVSNLIPDKIYLQLVYFKHFHRFINFRNPKTFNEKLQWLKINDRNPSYTKLVDKYAVKQYIADKIGEEYVIPTLGVWDQVEDIDFDQLPDQFVLKCTHDSGSIVICRDKASLDRKAAIEKLKKGLSRNDILSVMMVLTTEEKVGEMMSFLQNRDKISPDEVFQMAGKIAYGENA